VFRPLQISLREVLEVWERDRLGLFELVRGVMPLGAFLDLSSMTAVVEYLVELASGVRCSVKVVHADDREVYAASGLSPVLEVPPGSYEIDPCQANVECAKATKAAQAITKAKMSAARVEVAVRGKALF